MDNADKTAEANHITSLLSALMRRLFSLDDDLVTDLPLAQLKVCAILREGPHPMSVLSRELGVSLSAMTQIADRLERAELVSRIAEGTDRRVRCLRLTPKGELVMHQREDHRIKRVRSVLNHLSPEERKEIANALEMLMHASLATGTKEISTGHYLVGMHWRGKKMNTTKVIS